jgi:ABC-type glycerol-3-phosphate transport system substrate-binding protein
MKKSLLLLTTLFVVQGLLFAGGQQEAKKPSGPITLTVWDFKYGEVASTGPVMKEMDDLFMEQNPDIIIEHVGQPSGDAYYNLLRTTAASNNGPDIFMTHGGSNSWEFNEIQIKLDDYIKPWRDQISEASWQFAATKNDFSNGIRQVPLTSQGIGFYYNKELFKKAGLDPNIPPTEWKDFKNACIALKAAGITPLVMPNTPSIATQWAERILSGNFYNSDEVVGFADGSIKFTDPGMKVVASSLKEIMDNWIGKEDKSLNIWKEGIPIFKNGKAAMTLGLLSDIACWKDLSEAIGNDNLGYFPNINLPGNKYNNSQAFQPVGLGYSVATWSKHVEAAVKYLEFYSAGDGAKIFTEKLGALVPNVNLDLSTTGYTVFTEIQKSLKNVHLDYNAIISQAVPDIAQYMVLYYNLDEISIDEYLAKGQKAIAENYLD